MSNEFDYVEPYNQCFLVLPCMLSACEALALSLLQEKCEPTFAHWSDVLDLVGHSQSPYQSDGDIRHLSDFLEVRRPRNRVSIKRSIRSPKTPDRLATIYGVILESYLEKSGALSTFLNKAHEDIDLRNFQLLLGELIGKFDFVTNGEGVLEFFRHVNPEFNTDSIVERAVSFFVEDKITPRHPLFKSCDLFDSLILPTEFFKSTVGGGDDVGGKIYAIVREARGWATSNPDSVNSIVRDILWIPRHRSKLGERESLNKGHKAADQIGHYISAVENSSFTFRYSESFGDVTYISANMSLSSTVKQSLNLRFYAEPIQDTVHVRTAQVSGVLDNNEKLGSWKCLMIRPNWSILGRLEAIFSRVKCCHTRKIVDVCNDVGAVGLIFNNAMRAKNGRLHQRRAAFRSLSATVSSTRDNQKGALGVFSQRELSNNLFAKLSDAVLLWGSNSEASFYHPREQEKLDRMVSDVIEVVNSTISANWHLIEPSQIVTDLLLMDFGDGSDPRSYEQVLELLDLDHVEKFEMPVP